MFDGVELELFQLRLTLGLVVQFATDGALDQVQGSCAQLVSGYHSIDGADFQGVFCAVFLAGGNPLNRVINTDQAWQTHGAAKARVDAQLDFRQADLGAVGHDPEVGCQAHFQATTQRDAIDGCDGGYIEVFKIAEDLVGFEVASNQLGIRQLEVFDEFGDVGADDEHVFTAGNDDTLDRSVGLDRIYRLTQFVQG